jgi:acyl carrier protein
VIEGFEKFRSSFADVIEIDPSSKAISADTSLEDIDEWDSLGKFSFLSFVFSEYDVNLDAKEVNEALTVGGLWRLVAEKTGAAG